MKASKQFWITKVKIRGTGTWKWTGTCRWRFQNWPCVGLKNAKFYTLMGDWFFKIFTLKAIYVWIFFLKKDTLSGIFQILLISVTLRRTGMSQKWYSYQRHVPVPHFARDILSKSIKIIIFYKFHVWNEFSDHLIQVNSEKFPGLYPVYSVFTVNDTFHSFDSLRLPYHLFKHSSVPEKFFLGKAYFIRNFNP